MGRTIRALAYAGALFLSAASARAETWTVLDGRLTDAATGQTRPLSGAFDASSFEPDPPDGPSPLVLSLGDVALSAGDLALAPREPVEYAGLHPVAWLTIADAILVENEDVPFLRVRSGGELVAASDDEVTFRFHELRADASNGGRAVGRLGDAGLPRRLELEGTLHEVLQRFGLPGEECDSPPSGGGSPGGGGVIIRDGGAIISYESFDVAESGNVTLVAAPSGNRVLNRVTGEAATIGGELQIGGSVTMLNPAGVVFSSAQVVSTASVSTHITGLFGVTPDYTPTLEQLGMRAPDGAEITRDEAGALVVRSAGDLFVEGTLPEIEIIGLTSVTLRTPGRIVVTGRIALPSGVGLFLEAGRIDYSFEPPAPEDESSGEVVLQPGAGLPVYCSGLRPILPAEERVLGSFSLVATAAQPVEIDVRPRSWRNRLHPGSRQVIAVALFGSQSLDVRDVDPGSLRLGDGEAAPLARGGRPKIVRLRLNRDRYADLAAFFRVRDAEVAFGDSLLCLVAETDEGAVLEGCDAIDGGLAAQRPPPPSRSGLGGGRARR